MVETGMKIIVQNCGLIKICFNGFSAILQNWNSRRVAWLSDQTFFQNV